MTTPKPPASLGSFCWVSSATGLASACPRGFLSRCESALPASRAPSRPLASSWGLGITWTGGPADRAAAHAWRGWCHEAPALLLPRSSGVRLWPQLQAAGHPHS